MQISAKITNAHQLHSSTVTTDGSTQKLDIPPKATGYGSAVNGGELLFLALATCYCNDLYREAAKQNIAITHVEVECTGEFGAAGEPGYNIHYRVKVEGDAPRAVLDALVEHTDRVTEIHNTLRRGVAVTLVK